MDGQRTPMMVTLPESLLLVAIDDETGRIASKSGALGYGLAGAVLTELLLDGRAVVDDGRVKVTDGPPMQDSVLDGALARIRESKPHDAKYWVRKLSGDHLQDGVLERLIREGVLRREEHRILWVIPADRFPAEDVLPERAIRQKVRAVVLQGATPQPRTAALIGLLKACDLTGMVFDRAERRQYKARIDEISNGELMGKAVSKAVKEAQGAMAAVIAANAAVLSS